MKKNNLQYKSKDKAYKVKTVSKRKILKKGAVLKLLIIPCILIFIFALVLLSHSIEFHGKISKVGYHEIGDADYKVYLKDNNYYDTKYLDSGMKYVASLISSVNTKFNYEIHSDKNLDYQYTYNITSDLIIYDTNDSSKVLYTKTYNLLSPKTEKINSNNLVINEDIDIDYDEYNNYVNSYKRDYGISASSKLVVTMNVDVKGKNDNTEKRLNHKNKLQINIPLSEQTIDINIASDKINNKGRLFTSTGPVITNTVLFIPGILLLFIAGMGLILSIILLVNYRKKNIYLLTLHKFLRDYDRLIVNATENISEDKFERVIPVSSFTELVDAAENNRTSIIFFEAIPGEKSFFLVIKDRTLYKYRLTKAYLVGNPDAEELSNIKRDK